MNLVYYEIEICFVLIFFCACKNVKTDCQIDDLFTNRIFLEYEKIPSNGYIWGTPMDMIYCDSAIIVSMRSLKMVYFIWSI